jgi:hypothetical protein
MGAGADHILHPGQVGCAARRLFVWLARGWSVHLATP